ncbi:MAG: putative eukaryotic translation elongation factor 1 alpha 2 [Streblomastix strix]|uniref:Putative eukaryotic translation elongation factor 1 alpha 2 n=1 Tax=Streblomastix strix TaxID=222440 RepID=A0A5J4W768_9EUKA|nr:MAG: putative eukaryotic translation elongation factor 1 alpha 2 [Streblomastix strix]
MPGLIIIVTPAMIISECKTVEIHNEALTQAVLGDNVGFNLKGEPVKDIKRGFVCRNAKQDPPHESESFQNQVIVMQHPGQIQNEITSKIVRRANKELEQNIKSIITIDSAIVLMDPTKQMIDEKLQEYPPLGRFAVRDMRAIVAVCVIKGVTKKSSEAKVTKAAEKKQKKQHTDFSQIILNKSSFVNLFIVSRSQNNMNKSVYRLYICEYFDEIDDEAIVVEEYIGYEFENLYYHDNNFYFYNGVQYRKLYLSKKKNGTLYVSATDVDSNSRKISLNKFKKIRDLD